MAFAGSITIGNIVNTTPKGGDNVGGRVDDSDKKGKGLL